MRLINMRIQWKKQAILIDNFNRGTLALCARVFHLNFMTNKNSNLSVIVHVFNEEKTLIQILNQIKYLK